MKPIKLFLLCFIVTLVMAISWSIGSLLGNLITSSAPPPLTDASNAGLAFLGVCVFNSVLIVILLRAADLYYGRRKKTELILFVFTIQTLLPQMETFFFASGIGIGYDQATAIVIAGVIMSFSTVMIAVLVDRKLLGPSPSEKLLVIPGFKGKKILPWLALLTCVAYPLLYLTFGYYVAWQNESLRIYYTDSAAMTPYFQGIGDALMNGIYFFQILRSLIWIIVTVPIAVMLKEKPVVQLIVIGLLTSLLPTSLLFIPNPYMPANIAMVHFVETAISNLVWGLLMVIVIRKFI